MSLLWLAERNTIIRKKSSNLVQKKGNIVYR